MAVRRIGTGTDPARDQVAIEGPVEPGQSVITLGQQDLRDGVPIVVAGAETTAVDAPPAPQGGTRPGL